MSKKKELLEHYVDYRFKNINIQQDMNNFIERNKTDLKGDDPIPFIPYSPEADLTKNFAGIEKKVWLI